MGSYLTDELASLRVHIEQLNKMFQALPIVDIKKSKSLVSILKLDESKSRHPVGILSSDDYIAVRQRLNESANLFNKISSLCKLLSEEKDKENDPRMVPCTFYLFYFWSLIKENDPNCTQIKIDFPLQNSAE